MHADCVFCKIIAGQIPSQKVYEDEMMLAFHDIHPAAPVHVLIIPKIHISNLFDCTQAHTEMLGKMALLAPQLAKQTGADNGFRFVINNGVDGRQEVYHLHAHILGGAHPWQRQT
ncbi:MAG: histidine triad nucleotide-binding protein [Ottowia sp.]|nr:histidine triad nucleotide-binding protein [Ottowia sp.]